MIDEIDLMQKGRMQHALELLDVIHLHVIALSSEVQSSTERQRIREKIEGYLGEVSEMLLYIKEVL